MENIWYCKVEKVHCRCFKEYPGGKGHVSIIYYC